MTVNQIQTTLNIIADLEKAEKANKGNLAKLMEEHNNYYDLVKFTEGNVKSVSIVFDPYEDKYSFTIRYAILHPWHGQYEYATNNQGDYIDGWKRPSTVLSKLYANIEDRF